MACADPVKSTVPDDASSSTITGTTTTTTTTTAASSSSGLKNRRQKRLERNRESARLSRRRRKQYLEVLEERVSQLSHEMDCGRRHHAAHAVGRVRAKRAAHATLTTKLPLPSVLLRTSAELRVAATFGAQQLHSFCAPPAHKFALWLTLQADDFFRGGRAASERLSAARIGERVSVHVLSCQRQLCLSPLSSDARDVCLFVSISLSLSIFVPMNYNCPWTIISRIYDSSRCCKMARTA